MKNKWIAGLLAALILCTAFLPSASAVSFFSKQDDAEETVEEQPKQPEEEEEEDSDVDGFSVTEFPETREIFKDEPHAAMLIEMSSDTVLYALDMHEQNYPASLTKIMTCYLALTHGNLNDTLTVSAESLQNLHESGSTADLIEGEQMTLENMLYCTMVASANEACNVIAEYISGSVEEFVVLMNQTAKELGCLNTNFVNPHGLHDPDHYTSAYDLSLIVKEALKNEDFRKITSVASYTVPKTNLSEERKLTSTNMLLVDSIANNYRYTKASGVKTGFTTPAQCCLVSTADDGNMQLLSIMLGAPIKEDENGNWVRRSFPETINLFEYGFEAYSISTVMSTLYPIAEVKVTDSQNVRTVALAPTEEIRTLIDSSYTSDDIVLDIHLKTDTIEAPVEAGEILGSVTVSYKGMVLGHRDLATITAVSSAASSRANAEARGLRAGSLTAGAWWKVLLAILLTGVSFIVIYIIWIQIQRKQMRRKKLDQRRRALERERKRREFQDFYPDN